MWPGRWTAGIDEIRSMKVRRNRFFIIRIDRLSQPRDVFRQVAVGVNARNILAIVLIVFTKNKPWAGRAMILKELLTISNFDQDKTQIVKKTKSIQNRD